MITSGTVKDRPPLVKLVRWKWREFSWSAYQHPDGRILMSERQISQQMRQSLRSVKNFIKTEKTAVESVRLPNNQTINALPLTSVAEYWEYLVRENLIPKKIPYKVDWQELIEFLKDPGRSQESDSKVSEEYYSTAKKAQKLLIQLETIHLEILILPGDEYRISYESGLELIDELSRWLEHLEESINRKIILQSKGFTGTVQVCKIKDKGVNKLVKALDLDDWIKGWEYFAKQGILLMLAAIMPRLWK